MMDYWRLNLVEHTPVKFESNKSYLFKQTNLKMSFLKWAPLCLDHNMLTEVYLVIYGVSEIVLLLWQTAECANPVFLKKGLLYQEDVWALSTLNEFGTEIDWCLRDVMCFVTHFILLTWGLIVENKLNCCRLTVVRRFSVCPLIKHHIMQQNF